MEMCICKEWMKTWQYILSKERDRNEKLYMLMMSSNIEWKEKYSFSWRIVKDIINEAGLENAIDF